MEILSTNIDGKKMSNSIYIASCSKFLQSKKPQHRYSFQLAHSFYSHTQKRFEFDMFCILTFNNSVCEFHNECFFHCGNEFSTFDERTQIIIKLKTKHSL